MLPRVARGAARRAHTTRYKPDAMPMPMRCVCDAMLCYACRSRHWGNPHNIPWGKEYFGPMTERTIMDRVVTPCVSRPPALARAVLVPR